MGYISNMKTKPKEQRVFRGVYLPEDMDNLLREISAQERRSVTQTVLILLENALKRGETA